ncbi:FAD dependent oxidoreductase [Amanita muscaria]
MNEAGRKWSLDTPRGWISCRTVIHATNAYGSQLVPSLSSIVVPTRGQVIAAEMTVTDPTPSVYLKQDHGRPTTDLTRPNSTTVILGGGREASSDGEYNLVDDSVVNPRVTETIRSFLPRAFPAIKMEVKVTMEWTGIMGFTKSGNPIVGKIADGQFISLGYNGHGMPLAYGCAEAIAGMIAAELQGKKWDMPAWFPKHYSATRWRYMRAV